ncbi:DUF6355 family natural product biosynthesis protein [Paenarthrobacter sp. YIM B13468]|uniref:DUF6355 family natural product biosynthesis protein n=1 Tax=Paenarthrobacter sp. YIM B13468 TaxID=3366295 RepID=UPI00367284AC
MKARKITGILSAVLLVAGGIAGASLVAPEEAKASVCGYSQEVRSYNSILSLSLLGQTLDPFGGQKVVSVYGHCGPTNVKIVTESPNGNRYVCVPPGDSWLGFVNQGDRITGAYYVGLC